MSNYLDLEALRLKIDTAAKKSGGRYTQFDLHRDYEALGGTRALGVLEDWLRGKHEPKYQDVAILSEALATTGKKYGIAVPVVPRLAPVLKTVAGTGKKVPARQRNAASRTAIGYFRLTPSHQERRVTGSNRARRIHPIAA